MKAVGRNPLRIALRGAIQFAGAILLAHVAPAHAAPGDLDATFAQTGFTRAGFPGGDDRGNAMVQQFDGKFVVAGRANFAGNDFAVYRYNTDGSLDSSFGDGGKVLTSFGPGDDFATSISIQADGKLIVAGLADSRVAIARYNIDGSLDASFGVGGKVLTASSKIFLYTAAVALQADGKIVVATTYYPSAATVDDFAVLRFNADGSPDVSFDGDGLAATEILINDDALTVAIQPDGKIVAAGSTVDIFSGNYEIAIERLNTDGSLDTTFDGDGKVITDIGPHDDAALTIGLQVSSHAGDFRIVVGGYTSTPTDVDFALVRYNYNGSLDTTFDGDGIAVTPITAGFDVIQKIAIQYLNGQPSRIVAAGYAPTGLGNDFVVAKYFLDGTLDPSFGGDGIATTAIGPDDDAAMAMVIAAGKYVAAGYSRSASTGYDCALVRYNSDGSLDATFDGDGKRTDDLGSLWARAGAVVVQPDDKVVAAGYVYAPDSTDFAVVRFAADGSLDPTFGGDGRVATSIATGNDVACGAALQPDGKIVAGGYTLSPSTSYDFAVVRYNADGTLDPSFSSDGIEVTSFGPNGDFGRAVALQPDGKIILAGAGGIGFALARYAVNGSLDASFGTGGKVTTAVGTGGAEGTAIALQPDGKIVVAGYADVGGSYQFAAVRYNANGNLDASFDGDGIATTPMGASGARAYAVAIQADGKIVLTGSALVGTENVVAIARYDTNGSLDATFDGDGKRTVTVGADADAVAVTIQPNGKIVVAGGTLNAPRDFLLLRFLPDGSLDASYGVTGRVFVNFESGGIGSNDHGAAIALDSEGRAVVAGASNHVFAVARVMGDGPATAAPEGQLAAAGFQLGMPRPNPARDRTEVSFSLATPGSVTAFVFDVAGRTVRTLANDRRFEAGTHSLDWDGRDNAGALVSSGVYFVRLRDGRATETRKVVLRR